MLRGMHAVEAADANASERCRGGLQLPEATHSHERARVERPQPLWAGSAGRRRCASWAAKGHTALRGLRVASTVHVRGLPRSRAQPRAVCEWACRINSSINSTGTRHLEVCAKKDMGSYGGQYALLEGSAWSQEWPEVKACLSSLLFFSFVFFALWLFLFCVPGLWKR